MAPRLPSGLGIYDGILVQSLTDCRLPKNCFRIHTAFRSEAGRPVGRLAPAGRPMHYCRAAGA